MLGVPVDLSKVDVDSYVVAGIADHLTPWQNCYRSTRLLGGDSRFVLASAGHIAALVNPPGNPKASYQVNEDHPADPAQWLRTADSVPGSWWPRLRELARRALRRREGGTGRARRWRAATALRRPGHLRPRPLKEGTVYEDIGNLWAPTTSTSPTS